MYIAAPVLPQVVTYVKEDDTFNLDCSNVITASASAIQLLGQMWLGNINGQVYTVSQSSTYFQSYSSLDISGNYTCMTKLVPNAYGVTNVTSTIQVVVYSMFLPLKLLLFLFVFLLSLIEAPAVWNCYSQNALLGGTGHITCSIGGIPVPSITWISPNGSVLVSESRYSISSDESSTTLTISSLVREDAGTYTINASNIGGMSSSYANLSFDCKYVHVNSMYVCIIKNVNYLCMVFSGDTVILSVVILYMNVYGHIQTKGGRLYK